MKTLQPISPTGDHPVRRDTIICLLNAALEVKSYRFAKQSITLWLNDFQGDLEVMLLLVRALIAEKKFADAEAVLRKITTLDPEFLEAQYLLLDTLQEKSLEESSDIKAAILALGGQLPSTSGVPEWGSRIGLAKEALRFDDLDKAQDYIFSALSQNAPSALPALAHLHFSRQREDEVGMHNLAQLYHSRWPECLAVNLLLADSMLKTGDETGAVSILHQCVVNDTCGQVPRRLWGERHAYRLLWPEKLEMKLDIPVPAEVAVLLGWNRLAAGGSSVPEPVSSDAFVQVEVEKALFEENAVLGEKPATENDPVPLPSASPAEDSMLLPETQDGTPQDSSQKHDSLKPVSDAFARVSKRLNRPEIGRMDGRFPMYILFSTKSGLVKQYGQQTAVAISREMKKLAQVIRKRPGWGAMVFCPDDIEASLELGFSALDTIDPWRLKLALHDLDKALAKKGGMIGALLIVGGDEVVPFHRLPNPTEDVDKDVPSDNPYSTLDTNYFVPEWPVGRLPGEAGSDAGMLIEQLRRLISTHDNNNQNGSWWQRVFALLRGLRAAPKFMKKNAGEAAFGYSAAAWRRSSVAVFRPLGKGESILISPPEFSGSQNPEKFTNSRLGYYNLHGLSDTSEWYGQKDIGDSSEQPDYPVALSAKDLMKNGSAPEIVFSEACYGGLIMDKTEGQAICLRFLNIGAKAVVASTCIAYGSVNTPLIGGDLLGYLFWKYAQEGLTAGEAFVRAKIETVREMIRRQGFLDAEDQKTIISFVLYGDPLLCHKKNQTAKKTFVRMRGKPEIKTVSDRQEEGEAPVLVSKEVLREVKSAVEAYLPGLEYAKITIGQEQFSDTAHGRGGSASSLYEGKNQSTGEESGRVVVTFRKDVSTLNRLHSHYARATLNKEGKVVKLALSR